METPETPLIVIIDKIPGALQPLVQQLQSIGYRCQQLATVTPALLLSYLQGSTQTFDLVVLNTENDHIVQLCECLRNSSAAATAAILLVGLPTAAIDSPSAALELGCDYYFSLPLVIEEVLGKVHTYIGMPQALTCQQHDQPIAFSPSNKIMHKLKQIHECNYYTILELDPQATTEQINEQSRRLLADFSLRHFSSEIVKQFAPALQHIQTGLHDAQWVLSSAYLRQKYTRCL